MGQLVDSSVCQRTEDEETVLLLPDPFQQLSNSRHGQGLGSQGTETEVELKATRYLRER